MSARVRRADRLVDIAEKAENAARAHAVTTDRTLSDARDAAQRDERQWSDAARDFAMGVARVSDLEEQAAFLRTLRRRADAAAQRVEKAAIDARACAAEVIRAATERRKLELWRDRIVDAGRAEESRIERIASDDLAARITRSES